MFVYLEEEEYPVNTKAEIEIVEKRLIELGRDCADVYCGQGSDQIKSGLVVFNPEFEAWVDENIEKGL